MRRWNGSPARIAGSLLVLVILLAGCGLLDDPPADRRFDPGVDPTPAPVTTTIPVPVTVAPAPPLGAEPTVPTEGTRLLRTDLTGAAAVPGPGDADGSARAILTSDGPEELCYSLMPTNLPPVVAFHVHEGAAGKEGPLVVDLTRTDTGSTRGCMAVGAPVIDRMAAAPGDYYVEVHTADPPGVAARGQLT